MTIRNVATRLLPPLLVDGLRRRRRSKSKPKREPIRFEGDYATWAEAERVSTGYSAPNILEKTRIALLKVKRGEAAYERDSVVFHQIDYPFPVLAGLLRATAASGGRLSVLDFGGSLGTTYFQCRNFLSRIGELRWSVVEQPGHVACGQKEFADEHLQFYETIDDCLRNEQPNMLLLSGVIQCLPGPYDFLTDALSRGFPHAIVDRTPFFRGGRDLLTVQHVPDHIYSATYPAWFFCEERFLYAFRNRYEMIATFKAHADRSHPDKGEADWKGFIFESKGEECSAKGDEDHSMTFASRGN